MDTKSSSRLSDAGLKMIQGIPPIMQITCPTVIHEFNHSFVNPAFAEHKREFASAGQIYERVADKMREQAYGNSDTMVIESLVRAAVIQYLETRGRKLYAGSGSVLPLACATYD
jgi:Domain of unknown function (DUF4932)